jgi:SAM-dependent methyltransferase
VSDAPKTRAELGAEQVAFWKGPGGQGWLASYGTIERRIADFGRLVLAEADARPGEQVIDVGCGTGGTTAVLAGAVGANGHVLGVDVSEPLIEAARARGVGNATFVVGDATTHPFKAASADLVFSRFGVMFFGDPVRAFSNLRRALKPSGRVVFICWRTPKENPWALVPLRAAAPFLPPLLRPGPEDPGQYSFGDRARVERILTEAGFGSRTLTASDQPVWLGNDAVEIADGIRRFGPLARGFAEAEPAAADKAHAAIVAALAPLKGPDGIVLPGACWLVRAGTT